MPPLVDGSDKKFKIGLAAKHKQDKKRENSGTDGKQRELAGNDGNFAKPKICIFPSRPVPFPVPSRQFPPPGIPENTSGSNNLPWSPLPAKNLHCLCPRLGGKRLSKIDKNRKAWDF
jgi:hypothetical protein